MRLLLITFVVLSTHAFSCDKDNIVSESLFLKDIQVFDRDRDGQICVSVLLDSYNASNDRYVSSVGFNIRNSDKNFVAFFTPKGEEVGYSQYLYEACFARGYLEKSVFSINSAPKPRATLKKGVRQTAFGSFCQETEYVELGKAIEAYDEKLRKNHNKAVK